MPEFSGTSVASVKGVMDRTVGPVAGAPALESPQAAAKESSSTVPPVRG